MILIKHLTTFSVVHLRLFMPTGASLISFSTIIQRSLFSFIYFRSQPTELLNVCLIRVLPSLFVLFLTQDVKFVGASPMICACIECFSFSTRYFVPQNFVLRVCLLLLVLRAYPKVLLSQLYSSLLSATNLNCSEINANLALEQVRLWTTFQRELESVPLESLIASNWLY